MSSESKKMKPKADFELILNYSNQCIWEKLKNESGAGANAASSVDKTFSAIDPLSEIVWSPDKGFSLKCVDSSFTNKNTSLFRDVEPSSMVLALLQSVTDGSSTTHKPVDVDFVEPLAVMCTKSNVSSTDTPTRHSTSDSVVIIPEYKAYEEHDTGSGDNNHNMEEMNTARGTPDLPNDQKENLMNYWEKNSCAQANIETTIISEIRENKSSTISATSAATSGVLVSKFHDNKNKSQVNETMLLYNKNLPAKHSPCNSRFHMTRNDGGQKSLSDGDSNVRSSKEENDSHLSCENYHSTELFLAGKKRCKQEVIIGSKRVKKQIQETSYSKSCVKRDSSFMNLFSNMMKGYSQSSQDEKSLALAHETPYRHLLCPDQKLLTCNRNQDPELKISGFKSNFQSMCCQSFENVGTRMSHQVEEASKDFELDKVHGIDATPVTCCAENNSLYRQYLLSNKSEASEGGHDAGPSSQPQIRPINFLNSHEHWKNNTLENENCYNLGLSKEKEGMPLHSLSTRQNNNNENVESCALHERKEICHKSDTLGDLWITRFSPKSTGPLMFFDHLNERGGSEVHSTYCSMLPHHHKHIPHLSNCKVEEARQQSADDQEASTGLKDEKGNNDHASKHKFNHITSFPRLRDSEPMVSVFAKRLGAIKQCQQTE